MGILQKVFAFNFKQNLSMRNFNKKTIIFSISSIAFFVTTTAFTVFAVNTDFNDIRNKILKETFVGIFNGKGESPEEIAKYYPDTTITFEPPKGVDPKTKYVLQTLNYLPVYSIPTLLTGISESELDDPNFDYEVIDKKIKEIYGVSLKGKSLNQANGRVFYFYNGAGITAIFNKLYAKPTNKLENVTYQKMYNLCAKEYVRDFLKLMTYLNTTKKTVWNSECTRLLKQIQTNKNFDHYDEYATTAKLLFPSEKIRYSFGSYTYDVSSTYSLGTIIRRQLDGSLKSITDCLKKIVKDYDPEALKLIKGY